MPIAIRLARETDLDAMTAINIESTALDPLANFRFPHRAEYPEDHLKHTRLYFTNCFANPSGYIMMVAETEGSASSSQPQLMAYSIWRIPGASAPPAVGKEPDRRDTSPRREERFMASLAKARRDYFDKKFEGRYLNLVNLATHPSFQKQGAATRLVNWGKEYVRERNWVLTLFATSMAFPLYRSLGFEEIGALRVEGDAGNQDVVHPAMVWQSSDN